MKIIYENNVFLNQKHVHFFQNSEQLINDF